MKRFCFTVDDNIRFLKDLTEEPRGSIFDHPYLSMYRRLHEKYGLKVQLNLFYRMDGFDLTQMTDRYKDEFDSASDWLKLSFHSEYENVEPYITSGYDEVYSHCKAVHEEILRFASPRSLGKTTTIHYCKATKEGLKALKDNGIKGLLGLYYYPRVSYELIENAVELIRKGEVAALDGISHASIDMVINDLLYSELVPTLTPYLLRNDIRVMIHEQPFYSDHRLYQPDFEKKLTAVFDTLTENGYISHFFEEMI